MNKFAQMVGEKVGDIVEDAVTSALGGDKDDKKKKEEEEKGGFLSFFGGDKKKEEEEKGGLFSFGDDKKKEEEKGGFFSKIFDRDDDDGKAQKKSGFSGLFSEQEGGGAGGLETGSEDKGGNKGQSVAVSDRDLLDDLIDVANEK